MSSSSRKPLRQRVPAVFAYAGQCVAAINRRSGGANNSDFIEQHSSVRRHKSSQICNKRDGCLKHTGSTSSIQLSFLIVFQVCRTAGVPTS